MSLPICASCQDSRYANFHPGADKALKMVSQAAEVGHLDCLRGAISAAKCEGSHSRDETFNFALSRAAYRGHANAMTILLSEGATTAAWAMEMAICGGSSEGMRVARNHGVIEIRPYISQAACLGHVDCVKLMLEWGANAAARRAALENAVLILAPGNVACAKLLLQGGVEDVITILKDRLELWVFRKSYGDWMLMLDALIRHIPLSDLGVLVSDRLSVSEYVTVKTAREHITKYVNHEVHAFLLGTALAFWPLDLPPYVLLWITDWAEPFGLGDRRRIALLEGARNSARRIKGAV